VPATGLIGPQATARPAARAGRLSGGRNAGMRPEAAGPEGRMPAAVAVPLIDALLGSLVLGPLYPAAGNRVSLEGLAVAPGSDGVAEVRAALLEASSLRLRSRRTGRSGASPSRGRSC
jgi:hypothetical protein